MKVTTERVRQLRDRYATGKDLAKFVPEEVFRTGRDLWLILEDYLRIREEGRELIDLPEADGRERKMYTTPLQGVEALIPAVPGVLGATEQEPSLLEIWGGK